MSRNLLIVGAGGLGRELYSFAERHPDCGSAWRLGGFLDDAPRELAGAHPGRIVGTVSDYQPRADDLFLVGIGAPVARRNCVLALKARGAEFLSFCHPTAIVGRNVRLGEGVILLAYVNLTCDIEVGAHTIFLSCSGAGHDARIGPYCQISSGCDIMGHVTVGEGVLLGSGARLFPRVKVGDYATVGTGSVVITRVAPYETVFGNPARRLMMKPPSLA